MKECVDLLNECFGEVDVVTSYDNSVVVNLPDLSLSIWRDRGLYSVVISNSNEAYLSSVVLSFINVESEDAVSEPKALRKTLLNIKEKQRSISTLLNESGFSAKYEKASGFKPLSTKQEHNKPCHQAS